MRGKIYLFTFKLNANKQNDVTLIKVLIKHENKLNLPAQRVLQTD